MYNDGGSKRVYVCSFCGKICTFDIWSHYEECDKMPEKKTLPPNQVMMVPDVDQDWKDIIERKFEPHTFRLRWKNIICPFCLGHCKNIYHTFSCPFVPPERRQVNVKIAFWKA